MLNTAAIIPKSKATSQSSRTIKSSKNSRQKSVVSNN